MAIKSERKGRTKKGRGGSIKNDCLFMSPSYYSPIKYKSLSRSPLSPPPPAPPAPPASRSIVCKHPSMAARAGGEVNNVVEEENDAHRLHSFSSCLSPSPSSLHGRTPEEPRANKRDSPFTPLPPPLPPPCDPTAPVEPTLPPLLLGSSSLLSLAMSEEIVTVAVRGMPHNQPRADLLLPPPHIGRDPARHEERSGWNCWPPVRPSAVGLDSLAGISLLLSPIYPGGSSSSHLGWERGGGYRYHRASKKQRKRAPLP